MDLSAFKSVALRFSSSADGDYLGFNLKMVYPEFMASKFKDALHS